LHWLIDRRTWNGSFPDGDYKIRLQLADGRKTPLSPRAEFSDPVPEHRYCRDQQLREGLGAAGPRPPAPPDAITRKGYIWRKVLSYYRDARSA
jgi:hypothetical protein